MNQDLIYTYLSYRDNSLFSLISSLLPYYIFALHLERALNQNPIYIYIYLYIYRDIYIYILYIYIYTPFIKDNSIFKLIYLTFSINIFHTFNTDNYLFDPIRFYGFHIFHLC